ncbi:MAG TPA: hypothetical protein VKZ63_18855, partial [Kofleriaceae bacterium]|nr:hypothetical protein [Kofleriaceae bacterium]
MTAPDHGSPRRRSSALALAAGCLFAACDGGPPPPGERPLAPAENDPDFRVERVRNWLIIGNDLTPGQDTVDVQVFAPDGVETIDAWLGDQPGVRLYHSEEGDFRQIIEAGDLPAGEHELLLAADGSDQAFARLVVRRSHPLYVVVSTDWDDSDNHDYTLELQEQLHLRHPELRLTHFVGPYTFTDPEVTAERRTQLAAWVLDMRDTYDDEIGLHIHPYCNFVDTTGVPCRTEPSTVYADGDVTGYTVMCSAYSEEEFTQLLLAADELFAEAGLGKPTSFRAGGWTTSLDTLRALAAAGYVADTSANNWARMEEWEGVQNGVLYEWNKEHWATIGDTSQPYYPSQDDILSDSAPVVPLLEVPDNGIMVDYVTAEEMIEIFDANWDGAPLAAPVAYSIGYHPPNFNTTYQGRISGALRHVEQFLVSRDQGPVIFATLSELARVWPPP